MPAQAVTEPVDWRADGVPRSDFAYRTGLTEDVITTALEQAQRRGWLEHDATLLRTTETGQRFLNDVIELFLPEPERRHAR